MKLYPPAGGEPVDAHPTQVDNMKRAGWTEKAPPAKKSKKTTPKEEMNDGEV